MTGGAVNHYSQRVIVGTHSSIASEPLNGKPENMPFKHFCSVTAITSRELSLDTYEVHGDPNTPSCPGGIFLIPMACSLCVSGVASSSSIHAFAYKPSAYGIPAVDEVEQRRLTNNYRQQCTQARRCARVPKARRAGFQNVRQAFRVRVWYEYCQLRRASFHMG